ncbi:hypothetical protein TNCV_2936891 [Trichonephila clavipes]|nr:hypothetical protein TNCV_2936891 [Trichonephila clavipes]
MWNADYLIEKECKPVVKKIYRGQSGRSIDRLPIWCASYGDGLDVSRTDLLSQRTNGAGTKTRRAICRSPMLVNQRLLGAGKSPTQSFFYAFSSKTRDRDCEGSRAPQGPRDRNDGDFLKTESTKQPLKRTWTRPAKGVAGTAAYGRRSPEEQ